MTIGLRIRQARKQIGLTQAELAKAIGVDRVAVTNWENDKNEINGENLHKLCEILNVSQSFILYGTEKKSNYEKSQELAAKYGEFYVRLLELVHDLQPEQQQILEDMALALRSKRSSAETQ